MTSQESRSNLLDTPNARECNRGVEESGSIARDFSEETLTWPRMHWGRIGQRISRDNKAEAILPFSRSLYTIYSSKNSQRLNHQGRKNKTIVIS